MSDREPEKIKELPSGSIFAYYWCKETQQNRYIVYHLDDRDKKMINKEPAIKIDIHYSYSFPIYEDTFFRLCKYLGYEIPKISIDTRHKV